MLKPERFPRYVTSTDSKSYYCSVSTSSNALLLRSDTTRAMVTEVLDQLTQWCRHAPFDVWRQAGLRRYSEIFTVIPGGRFQ